MIDETQTLETDEAREAAENQARKERRAQEQTIEAAATVAVAQAVMAMPQYKGATLIKIEAGVDSYAWRGEARIRLANGVTLTVSVDAKLPGDGEK